MRAPDMVAQHGLACAGAILSSFLLSHYYFYLRHDPIIIIQEPSLSAAAVYPQPPPPSPSQPPPNPFFDHFPDLATATLDDLSAGLDNHVFTSVDLVNAYTARIHEVNPLFHAISELNPDALTIAHALDLERLQNNSTRKRSPLHGIPLLLKDNIATTDALNTTAGSFALLGARPTLEAPVATKLRNAGAIILGKATLGEWAQYRSLRERTAAGWSAVGGQALGAWVAGQDPHGSSSGGAVAVGLGLGAAALGTETSGSVVNPCGRGGLVGVKTTLGLTSRSGVVPISWRQDVVGPMARTVRDAATILGVIAGPDRRDNWTLAQPLPVPDYVRACDSSSLRGARIGVPRNGIAPYLSGENAPIMVAFERALRRMKGMGAVVTDSADFRSFDLASFEENQNIVLDTDFVSQFPEYLATLETNPAGIRNLEDLVEFTLNDPREEASTRGVDAWQKALRRNITNDSFESWSAWRENVRLATTEGITGALDKYGLDALVMPTFSAFHLTGIGGLPAVTVPLGFYPPNTPVKMNPMGTMVTVGPGIPFGISFVGRAWSEEKLIALAYAFEQSTMARMMRKPYLLPKVGLGDIVQSKPRRMFSEGMLV